MLTLPARISLDWQESAQPLVSNLRANVFVDDNSGMELGVAHDPNWYEAADPRLETRMALEWRG
ncbi:MAG TPA: hypothetical protein VJ777_01580, partial [Mycobacterium sp.]|nr:hypothetical protein [Mycobacterium sp.]